jgi:hypothetical protein
MVATASNIWYDVVTGLILEGDTEFNTLIVHYKAENARCDAYLNGTQIAKEFAKEERYINGR